MHAFGVSKRPDTLHQAQQLLCVAEIDADPELAPPSQALLGHDASMSNMQYVYASVGHIWQGSKVAAMTANKAGMHPVQAQDQACRVQSTEILQAARGSDRCLPGRA